MIYSNNSLRGWILVVLVIVFFATTLTLFLLLIQGKRITPTGNIVETGVIRVNSVPTNVDIFIDGQAFSKSGNLVQNVPLGTVTVTIEREGYTTWEKEVVVEGNRVKELFAQLYPEALNLQQVISQDIDIATYNNSETELFYTITNSEIPGENGLWKYRFTSGFFDFNREQKPDQIISFDAELVQQLRDNQYTLDVSHNGGYVLLTVPNQEIFLINTSGSVLIEPIQDFIGFYPDHISWFGNQSLLIQHDALLYELTLDTRNHQVVTYLPGSTPVYCSTKDGVVYWSDTNQDRMFIYEAGISREITEEIAELAILNNIIDLTCSGQEGRFIVEDTQGMHYFDLENEYSSKFGRTIDTEIIDFSENGRNVMYKTESNEYFVYNLTEINNAPFLVEQKQAISVGENTQAQYFSASNQSIVSVMQDEQTQLFEVFLSDKDGGNNTSVMSDVEIANADLVNLSGDNKTLYFMLKTNPEQLEEVAEVVQSETNLYKIELEL